MVRTQYRPHHQRNPTSGFASCDPVDGSNYLLRHRIMAHFHYDTGEEYLQAHEFGPAVRHLLQSVLMWPFDRRYHTYLARALARKPVAE